MITIPLSMKALRSTIVSTLVDSGGLNKPSAENYEKAIYAMCVRLEKDPPTRETYSRIAYDKVGQIVSAKDRPAREKIIADMRNDVEGWDACVYDTQRATYNALMDRSVLKPKAIKGLYKCKDKECQSDEFYVWQEQRRSGDEAMSTLRQCAVCGKRGKE